MAITDAGQICESDAVTTTNRITLSASAKAGGLMALGLGGRVASGYLDIVAITDSAGNPWDWYGQTSGYRAAWVAWAKAATPMQTTDWIEVKWSQKPQVAWISGHCFEGASGTPTAERTTQGTPSSVASRSIPVAGSDFLVLATVAYASATTTTTPLNSMVEQDTYDGGNVFLEFLSRNHTSGSTFTAGTTLGASRNWTIAVVSFPFEAMPVSGKSMPFLVGV